MTTVVSLDFETYSDVSLPQVGGSAYSRHPSTEVLMAAYSFDDGPIQQWIPAEGESMPDDLDEAFQEMANGTDVQFWAWNANFEHQIITNTLKLPVNIRNW